MIETNNPEIDVNQLMERVRQQARKVSLVGDKLAQLPLEAAWAKLPPPPELPPPTLKFSEGSPSGDRVAKFLGRAYQKNQVSSWIPAFLRGVFRRQGGFNRSLLETMGALSDENERLQRSVQELTAALQKQNEWLHALTIKRKAEAKWRDESQNQSCEQMRELRTESDSQRESVGKLNQMLVRVEDRQINDAVYIKGELSHLGIMVRRCLESSSSRGGEGEEVAKLTSSPGHEDDRAMDSFYLTFENKFRGSRTAITEKLRHYLPVVRQATLGRLERPVLDLGCGRGEWLELLSDEGLKAGGVDLNRAMIAHCMERDLAVVEADALEYVRSLPDGSQGAVTGFHIIEHLPLGTLMDLLAEAWRVLAPGGVVIFESPNCKNLLVGACHFYIDPTHRNPLFPETAQMMLEVRGFERVELDYPRRAEGSPFHRDTPESAWLDDRLFGSEDFAVIGHKG